MIVENCHSRGGAVCTGAIWDRHNDKALESSKKIFEMKLKKKIEHHMQGRCIGWLNFQ